MRHLSRIAPALASLSLSVALFATSGFAQTITDLPDAPVTPSGRLRIRGSGFGADGTVRIGGAPALTTVWRDDEVHAYVPESTPLGTSQVEITAGGGTSAAVPFEVVPRAADGRVAWRFAISSVTPNWHGVGVGPDGTIYADDTAGRLYAISPDGALLWIYDGNEGAVGGGLEGPIDVGSDGTIYYATNPLGSEIRVHAVNPDGTRKWMYSEFSLSYVIIAGPNVGPDGNLYMVFDRAHLGTLGACSLDPQGNLRWSNPGTPPVNDTGSLGHRLAFGPSAFYVAFNEGDVPGVTVNHLFGFGYDGTQEFAVPGAWSTGRPHERADGSFVLRWGLNNSIRSFDADGNEQWTFSSGGNLTEPVVGPDGVTYHQVADLGPKLHAIDPSGSSLWSVAGSQLGWMNWMGVSPDSNHLLDGGRAGFGQPGWIRSYSTANGELEWSIALPEEDPGSGLADLVLQSEWAFDADVQRGYAMVNTLVWDSEDGYGYLYAVDLDEPGEVSADCFGSSGCPCGNDAANGGCANSTGAGALLAVASGGASVAADELVLWAGGLPANQFGLIYMGSTRINAPFGDGLRCVGGGSTGIFRFPVQDAGAAGELEVGPGIVAQTAAFVGGSIAAGESWRFQAWYRDSAGPCGSSFNTSNALEVLFAE